MTKAQTIRKKDYVNHLSEESIVQEVLMNVNADKLQAANFTESELKRIEKQVAEKVLAETKEFITSNLLLGNRVEVKDAFLLRPFQSGYNLHETTESFDNVDRKRNKVSVVLRKALREELDKQNFRHLD